MNINKSNGLAKNKFILFFREAGSVFAVMARPERTAAATSHGSRTGFFSVETCIINMEENVSENTRTINESGQYQNVQESGTMNYII